MTLKKAIVNLVNSEKGSVRLNQFAKLTRWTKDALGKDCDCLEIVFDSLNGVCVRGFTQANILSRDYEGILLECDEAFQRFFAEINDLATKELKAGRWMGKDHENWVSI